MIDAFFRSVTEHQLLWAYLGGSVARSEHACPRGVHLRQVVERQHVARLRRQVEVFERHLIVSAHSQATWREFKRGHKHVACALLDKVREVGETQQSMKRKGESSRAKEAVLGYFCRDREQERTRK